MILLQSSPNVPERAWAWRLAAAVLILGAAAVRIVYLARGCPLDLAPDEAHYWDWSRHLDWSYYSKGPLVALLIRAGCELFGPWSRALTGNEALAVRLPAVLCGSLLLVSLYVLTVQVYRRERWALAVVGIALTVPLIAAGSTLMTIDAPFVCCWGWALVFGHRAIFCGGTWAWLAAGLCVLVGLLAKHTMILWVPSVGLFLLATPAFRLLLWGWRFWLMTAVGALGGMPILIWNMQNEWVTLRHTQGHMGAGDGHGITWLGPLTYVGTQLAVLLGFWFVAWARAAWAFRPGRQENAEIGYLWWMSVPVLTFFLLFSFKNGGGEPNWPVAGYVSGMVLAIGWLARELERAGPGYRRLSLAGVALTCVVGLVLTVVVHESAWFRPAIVQLAGPASPANPCPLRRFDPTCRLRGWHVLAAEVDRVRAQLAADGEVAVLACSSWSLPGEVGFYAAGQPPVYSLGLALGDRHSQYDLWHPNPVAEPDLFRGRTFVVVNAPPETLRPGFASAEPARVVTYEEDGHVLAVWTITIARGYRGFPPPPGKSF